MRQDRSGDDPERPEAWQVSLAVGVGVTVMLVLALLGLSTLVAGWYVVATVGWLAVIAVPGSPARRSASYRGSTRTVLWAPFVAPYVLGVIAFYPFDLLA